MRLTCPNCSARYEVDDDMIPVDGRDVQCSNCATTWFQPGRASERRPAAVHVERGADVAATEASEDPPKRPAPREIDPAVQDILRQEAEREARLRREQSEPVETQGEFPLEEGRNLTSAPRDTAPVEERPAVEPDPSLVETRRDLLPDIEELNSSLRDTSDRSKGEFGRTDINALDYEPRRRRGVRLGFLLVLILAAAGSAIYSNADVLAQSVSGLDAPLQAYVNVIDAGRFWLDGLARRLPGVSDS